MVYIEEHQGMKSTKNEEPSLQCDSSMHLAEVNKDFLATGFFNWTESLRSEYQTTLPIVLLQRTSEKLTRKRTPKKA